MIMSSIDNAPNMIPPPGVDPNSPEWIAPDIAAGVACDPSEVLDFSDEDEDEFHVRPMHCNVGAPMGRRETQSLKSSLLAQQDFHVRMPLVLKAGLVGANPQRLVGQLQQLLKRAGCSDPEALRSRYAIPAQPLIVRPVPDSFEPTEIAEAEPVDVLFQALILGLCTSHIYDPRRPVIWTANSLSRRVALFEPEGFYL